VTGVQTCALPISPKPQNPDYYHHKEKYNIQKMATILDPHFKYLESHHYEFDKLVTEALASNNPIVQQAALA